MRFACCAVVAVVVALAALPHRGSLAAVVVAHGQDDNSLQQQPQQASGHGNWAMAARVADECARDADTTACVAVKAAAALERAARSAGSVTLFPGLVLTKNADAEAAQQRDSRSLPTEDELRGQLKPDAPDHATRVADMVVNSGLRFLQSRTLQFKFPQTDAQELSRAIEEGRGKLKKKIMPILAVLAVKIAAVLPFMLGIIGFFALKALVLGKLALIIASVMAFQKYGSSGGFGKFAENFSSANVAGPWSQPAQAAPAGGGYYRRSMDQAQQMAYNGQMQPSVQTVA